jgi:hypothetical protein
MPQGAELLANAVPDPGMPQPALIEVIEAVGASTVYALQFALNVQDADLPLLLESRLGPQAELAVRVPDGDGLAVLVRGPVSGQRIALLTGGGGASLTVLGADLGTVLAREHKVRVWPSTTDAAAITELASGAGWLPQIDLPGGAVHDESKNTLVQRESDLQLLRRLARRNGCWFWFSYEPTSALATAHVQRPPVGESPAVVFHLGGAERNIERIDIEWDSERVVGAQALHRDVFAATDIDGSVERSPLTGLADTALIDIVGQPSSAQLSLPVDDGSDLLARSEGALIDDGWFVRATLSVSARQLGQVVRAHSVAELAGAGSRHSGKYLVSKVVHRIDDADHLMDVTLIRNAWNGG